MRAMMILFGTAAMGLLIAALLWRPVTTLALALLGAAISVWRANRRRKPAARATEPALVEIAPSVAGRPTADPAHAALADRLAAAGWSLEPAVSGAPWAVAGRADVRVAMMTAPRGPEPTESDVDEALAVRFREHTQYAAILSARRPADAVAAYAKDSRVQIVSMARLEAYLALAAAFKPSPRPQDRRVSA